MELHGAGVLSLEPPQRGDRPRIAVTFLASAVGLALLTCALSFYLVGGAVEDRLEIQIAQTARLLGDAGFPLGDGALRRVANLIGAEVVVVDTRGQVVAASLESAEREAFEAARGAGALPAVPAPGRTAVGEGLLHGQALTVGVTPVVLGPGGRPGGLYLLYPGDLIAAQVRSAWLPVAVVALLATLLATLLGVLSERAVLRARTAALLGVLVSVAHELRNPLGAIRSLAASLQDPQREPAELIAAEAERLGLLVEGLRSVGQPVRTVRREVSPDEEVRAVARLLSHQLAHRAVELVDELAAPAARVEADPVQLRQIALNLLQNAAEAMPRGGLVRLRSQAQDGRWTLEVEDQGPGVPHLVRGRLFAPFLTTKPKGLGVGLYLSRRLAEAHGARLALDETFLQGARFQLSWPLRAAGEGPS